MDELRPASPNFSLVALCLRSVLDDLWARVEPLMTHEAHEGSEVSPVPLALDEVATAGVDARYLELCCPALAEARRVLQVRLLCGDMTCTLPCT